MDKTIRILEKIARFIASVLPVGTAVALIAVLIEMDAVGPVATATTVQTICTIVTMLALTTVAFLSGFAIDGWPKKTKQK